MTVLGLLWFIVSHPLNRDKPAAAMGRFGRWQIVSRLIPGKFLIPFVDDFYLLMKKGMTGATGNWYCGLHEPSEMAFVLHMLRPGDLFVDVGANIGSYSILACAAGAETVTVEPIPTTFADLVDNLRVNGLSGQVQALCCGISQETGVLLFTSGRDTMNRVLQAGETEPYIDVHVRTLDDICAGKEPTIIKIDVEGHELCVLKGGQSVLTSPRLKAVIMETNSSGRRYGVDDAVLFVEMERLGFRAFTYNPTLRRLEAREQQTPNAIFIRDLKQAEEQCRNSRRYKLCNGNI